MYLVSCNIFVLLLFFFCSRFDLSLMEKNVCLLFCWQAASRPVQCGIIRNVIRLSFYAFCLGWGGLGRVGGDGGCIHGLSASSRKMKITSREKQSLFLQFHKTDFFLNLFLCNCLAQLWTGSVFINSKLN